MRVLASELTAEQIRLLTAEKDKADWRPSSHERERMAAKGVTWPDVRDALKFGRLIEFNDEASESRRTLWRDMDTGVCVVLDLDYGRVITVWRNRPGDNHATLRRDAYHWGNVEDSTLKGIDKRRKVW